MVKGLSLGRSIGSPPPSTDKLNWWPGAFPATRRIRRYRRCPVSRPARCYPTYQDMATAEGRREDRIDFLTIVTPNNSHYAVAKTSSICRIPHIGYVANSEFLSDRDGLPVGGMAARASSPPMFHS